MVLLRGDHVLLGLVLCGTARGYRIAVFLVDVLRLTSLENVHSTGGQRDAQITCGVHTDMRIRARGWVYHDGDSLREAIARQTE